VLKVDEIYNHKVKLYMTAKNDLSNLFERKKSKDAFDE
jgi:predicted ATPase